MTRKITNFVLLSILLTCTTAVTRAQLPISLTDKPEATTGNNRVAREQMAAFIIRALGELNPPPPASQRFADVPPSNPFYNFIDRAVELRIVQGCSRTRYCPDEPVAREQMAAFIIRAVGVSNPPTPAKQRFADVPPANPFYAFIDLTASRKLIAGCGGNNFCPKQPVTRAEATAAIRKAFRSKSNSSGPKGGGQQKSPAAEQIPLESFQVAPAATASLPNPQIEFAGKELYDANGAQGTRYKLSVLNRASHPASLWLPSANLPPCGNNKNASRTWVDIFGSPGNKRLYGFCGVRSSEDLGHLWFPVPAGERGPQCVYIVMTDRQTGKKYISNRVCSRSFAVVVLIGSLKSKGEQQEAGAKDRMGNFEIQRLMSQYNENQPGTSQGNLPQSWFNLGPAPLVHDSSEPANKKARAVQPDLRIRQFLFPPTNDKALRVHVVNAGQAAAGACRLVVTVRKINGVSVGRKTHVNVPALAAGADVWLHIDAKGILPNNVSLQSTTFKLNVDATEIVVESNEGNNEVWHNL